MENESELVRAKIGNIEAPIINRAYYVERPASPDIQIGSHTIKDPVRIIEKVVLIFDSTEFIQAARSLFNAQLKNPRCEPGLLIFNDEGESVRGVIQKVSEDMRAGQVSLAVSLSCT